MPKPSSRAPLRPAPSGASPESSSSPRRQPGGSARHLSFGPACTPELHAVGLTSDEEIRALGWEEAFLRWTARFPARINVNAAYGMLAAERGVNWLQLSDEDKAQARRLVGRLRVR